LADPPTLAITWPQGFSGQSRQHLAAAHVDGLVGKPMVDTPQTPLRSSAILSHDYRFKNLRKLGNRIMITAKRLNICKPTISNVSRAKIPHDACNFSVVLGEAFTQDSEDWQPECF
jgi:hypothetical protein